MEGYVANNNSPQQDAVIRWYPMRIFHSSVKRQNGLNELLVQEDSIERTYVPQSLVDPEKKNIHLYTRQLYIPVHILEKLEGNQGKQDEI